MDSASFRVTSGVVGVVGGRRASERQSLSLSVYIPKFIRISFFLVPSHFEGPLGVKAGPRTTSLFVSGYGCVLNTLI